MCFCQLCSILPPVCSICIVSRAGYWRRQCNISPSARLCTYANCAAYSPVVQYICRQPCWILAVTMQYIAVGEVIYVCQLCSIFAGRAEYLLSVVPDTAGDYAIYRCRRGSFFFQLCSLSAAGRAVYLPSAVPDTAGDYAIYRRRLCNAPVGFRTDIPAETDLTARLPRHSRCRTLAPGCRRSASRCRYDRRAQSRWRGPRRRGRYTSRTGRCSSGRR